MSDKLYTEQDVKLMLIENNLTSLTTTVGKLEERNYVFQWWVIGSIIGLYGVIITAYFVK